MLKRICQAGLLRAGTLIVLIFIVCCSSKDASGPNASTSTNGNGGTAKSKEKKKASDEADFFPLKLDQDFKMFPGETAPKGDAWTSDGTIITCKGDPKGYIYTNEIYENFTLRFDYMFPKPADEKKLNTGVLVYIGDQNKVWPASLEVQGKYTEMGQIKPN